MEILRSRNGYPIPVINQIPLHSKIDPLKEAESFSLQIPENKTIVVIGLGFGYHLLHLCKKKQSLVIIEPDLNLIQAFHQAAPAPELRDLRILSGPPNQIAAQLENIRPALSPRHIFIKSHQTSFKTRPDLYQPYLNTLNSWLEKEMLNLITDVSFAQLWTLNSLKNLSLRPQAPMIQNQSGSPAIILGSGYSLLKAIPFLKKYQSQVIIIAIPPVLELLKKEKIVPDLVILVDGGLANRYYLSDFKTPLLAYLSSAPVFIKNWQGPVYFLNSSLPVEEYLIPDFPLIPLSGSAANTALTLANSISDTIFIAGFDFSYYQNHYHYPGNPLEKELIYRSTRFDSYENKLLGLMRRSNESTLRSFKGSPIKTNLTMAAYYQDFCRKLTQENQKTYYVLDEESVFLPKAIFFNQKVSFPRKLISLQPFFAEKYYDKQLKNLKTAILTENLSHPVLDFYLTRSLLKKIDNKPELKKLLGVLEKLIELF